MTAAPETNEPFLALAVPPGWIELKAFTDDDTAVAWFGSLLDLTPDLFDDEARAELLECYRIAREQVRDLPVDSAGALMTAYDGRATVWTYTATLIAFPPSGELNAMTVLQRYLRADGQRHVGPDDLIETFDTDDGREVVAVHTSVPLDADLRDRLSASLPDGGQEPGVAGVVQSAIRIPRAEGDDADRAVLVTGVAPRLEERLPMSLVAAQLTLSARLLAAGALPHGKVVPSVTSGGEGVE
jgi:hypothetical protein